MSAIFKYTGSRTLLPSFGLACQTAFIDFQINGIDEPNIGWDTIAGPKSDEITWD
jgi:hypothetical protein